MKEVVVLRHGDKSGDELTSDGVKACEDLARTIGRFSVVISSETNRTAQTAELLSGSAVKRDSRANVPSFPASAQAGLMQTQANHPLGIVGGIWQSPELIDCALQAGQKLLELVREVLAALPDDGRALIVSHDGTMVPLEKLLRGESFDTVDHSFGPLQGILVDENLTASVFTPHD